MTEFGRVSNSGVDINRNSRDEGFSCARVRLDEERERGGEASLLNIFPCLGGGEAAQHLMWAFMNKIKTPHTSQSS